MIPNHPDPIRIVPSSIKNYRDEEGAKIIELAGLTSEQASTSMGNAIFERIKADHKRQKGKTIPKTIDAIIKERRYEHGATFGNKALVDLAENPEISDIAWAALILPRAITGTMFALSSLPIGPLRIINPFFLLRCICGIAAAYITEIDPAARKEQAIRTILEGTEERKNTYLMEEKGPYDKDKQYLPGVFSVIKEDKVLKQITPSDLSKEKPDIKVFQKEDPGHYSYRLKRHGSPLQLIGTEEDKKKFEAKWALWVHQAEGIVPHLHNKTWFIILKAKVRDLIENDHISMDDLKDPLSK